MVSQGTLRVAFIAHEGTHGGADLLLLELVRALTESGSCECLVVVPTEGALATSLREAGVRVSLAEFGWWSTHRRELERPSRTLAVRRALHAGRRLLPDSTSVERALDGFSPHVVASNTCVIPAGTIAAARLRVPHVWLAQEYGREDYGLTFFFGFVASMRFLGWGSRVVVAISSALGRSLERYVPARKIHVLHTAVLTPAGSPQSPRSEGEPLRLVFLGSGVLGKGVEDAIAAVGIARARGIDVELRLVGGHDRARCDRLISDADVTGAVVVVGRVDDPVVEIDRAHVGLMCSRSEAFGRVTVEYLRRGRPVIGTRSGGTPELVEDGVTGLLYEPGDYVALADRIARFASSPEMLADFSCAALARNTDRFVLADYLPEFCRLLRIAVDAGPTWAWLDRGKWYGARRRPRSPQDGIAGEGT